MEKLHFSIEIDAPRETVWNTMLDDPTYRAWTAEFMPGSHYVGAWEEGSKILFLGPGENGDSGMVSRIRVSRPHEHVSIEHIGFVEGGQEDTTSEAVKAWAGALENYTFRDVAGGTEVQVDMDTDQEHKAMFESKWPKALQRLKELAEQLDDARSPSQGDPMELGAFSVSLAVKDLEASRAFYEKLGFQVFAGDATQHWLIMKNGSAVIGLFQGMFERNILTFNPGWSPDAETLDSFTDVREIQRRLREKGVRFEAQADEDAAGPGSFAVVDPDGNPILVDQHV